MTKIPAQTRRRRARKRRVPRGVAGAETRFEHDRRTGHFSATEGRVAAVMKAAERSGLLDHKSSRIAGRISPALLEQARKRTGIEADTDLIAFALANIALQDDFPEAFKATRGKVDGGLKLGF